MKWKQRYGKGFHFNEKRIKLGLKHLVVCKDHQKLRQKSILSSGGGRAVEILKDPSFIQLKHSIMNTMKKALCNDGEFSNGEKKIVSSQNKRGEVRKSPYITGQLRYLLQYLLYWSLLIKSSVCLKDKELWGGSHVHCLFKPARSTSCNPFCCTYISHVYSSLPRLLSSFQTLKKDGARSQDLILWEKMTEVKRRTTIRNLGLRLILHLGQFSSL